MIISESWDKILSDQFSQPYIQDIQKVITRDAAVLCPKPTDLWNAFRLCSYEQTKIVIILQD